MAADPPASTPSGAPDPAPEAQRPAPAPRAPRRRPRWLLLVVAALVVAAAVFGIVQLVGGDDDEPTAQEPQSAEELADALRTGKVLTGPASAPFAMRFTDDWEPLAGGDLEAQDSKALTGLRRKDGSGVITVTVAGPVRGGINSLRERLPDDLAERFDDFSLISIRPVNVAAGRALYTSFVREKAGQVQSQLVVPEGNRRSYTVDAVIRTDAEETAQQVGAMLRTFDLPDR